MANWTQQIINNVKSLKEKSSLLSNGSWTDDILNRYSPKYITDPYKKVTGGIDFKKLETLNKKKNQAMQAINSMPDEFQGMLLGGMRGLGQTKPSLERPETFISQYKKSNSIISNTKIRENWVRNELAKQKGSYVLTKPIFDRMPYYELRREFPEVEQLEQRYKNERLSPMDKAEDVALDRIRLSQKKFTTTDIYDPKTDTWRAKNISREYIDPNKQLYDDFETTTKLFVHGIPAGLVGYETEEYKKALESGDFMSKLAASSGNLVGFIGGLYGAGLITKGLGLTGKVVTGLTKIGISERKARIGAGLLKSGVDFTLLGQVHSTVRGDSWKEHFKSAGVDFVSGIGLTLGGMAVSKLPKFMQPIVEGSIWAGIAKAQGADNQTALIQGILFGGMRGFGLMKPSMEGTNEITADKFLTEAERFLKVKRTDTKGIVEAFDKKTKNLKQGTLEYQKAEASAVALLYPRQVFGMVKNVGSFQESRPVGLFGKGKFKEGERPGIEKAAPMPEVKTQFGKTHEEIKQNTQKYVQTNYSSLKESYKARVKQEYGSENVISADEAKYILPDYTGELAISYHEASSAFAKQYFKDLLQERKGKGNDEIIFMSGGTGSGKTTALKENKNIDNYAFIYDTNLTGKGATDKIRDALNNNYQITVLYVQRDPIEAFKNGVIPRVRSRDRLLSIDEHITRHKEAFEKLEDIKNEFGDKVNIEYIDNTRGKNKSMLTTLDKLPKFDYNETELKNILYEYTRSVTREDAKEVKQGITPDEFLAITGTRFRPVLRGELEQKRQGRIEKEPQKALRTDRIIGIGGEKKLKPEELYRRGEIGDYEYNQKIKKTVDPIAKTKGFFSTIGEIADKYIGTVSTRLANINPEIKTSMRRFEFDTRMATKADIEKSMPMLKKVKSMNKADRADFDLARKNGDKEMVGEIEKKYGMEEELAGTRAMLDDVYRRLKETGYDKIQYLKDYFPRVIKDSKGFLEYLTGTKDWPLIQKAIQAHEKKLGRNLDIEEKAALVNTLLRGFRSDTISLSEIGAAKARIIEKISPELNQFYMDTDSALLHYINSANESIAARKFFGKGKETSIDDSIGMYVLDLIQKGKITPTQEIELTNILKARFNARGPGAAMNVFKNLSYIGAMGSPSSAITQMGDVAFTLYKGGAWHTAKGVYKSLFGGKSKIIKQDIGIEKIAQEFEDATLTGKAVTSVFKAIGLDAMDTFGKNSLINAMFSRYRSELNNPKKSKATENKLRKIFGEETSEVIADIKAGKTSENVKFLLFNELSEVQPISLLEVPEGYLRGGNGRVFYMLKTYTIKLFDVYRNEVFKQMANKETRIEGMKNLVKLTSALMVMNASADYIKDFLFGRNIDLEDIVVDNIFKLFGVSRYITWQARTEGIYTAITKQILPPFSFIDNAGKDVAKFFTDQDKLLEEGFESTQTIPLVGKLYYWWLGKGRTKSEKERIGGEYRPFKLIQDSKGRILTPEEGKEITEAITKAVESGEMTDEQAKRKIGDVNRAQFNLKQIARYKELGYDKETVRIKVNEKANRGEITEAQAKDIYAAF